MNAAAASLRSQVVAKLIECVIRADASQRRKLFACLIICDTLSSSHRSNGATRQRI